MSWFNKMPPKKEAGETATNVITDTFEDQVAEYLKSKIEKLLEKLPPGYNIVKTEEGWKITGPRDSYSVEKNPFGWGVRPTEEEGFIVRPESEDQLAYPGATEKRKDVDLLALEQAIPRIKFRDAVTRLQNILKEN
tara:strand:+ start:622 stop:1029 length:408 start_codon:yes stop_codon:yes gene_type:complete